MSANPHLDGSPDQRAPWQKAILQGTSAYYSELADEGVLRPIWQEFFSQFPKSDSAKLLNAKRIALAKQIKDNGITYNVYADQEQGASRPWSLDLLPFIVDESDWAVLSAGVAQRACLLNQIMVDAYSSKSILSHGLLPTDLMFGHNGFLPQMQGIQPNNGVWLHLIAFDLGRGPDGRWWVIGNRLQAPSGLGYALENRLSISRSFTRSFRDMQVQHLAKFYKTYIASIQKLSPKGENTRIALLTPGPHNETYFEHTYLARYLGISLVEANDLVVRQNKVFLKTVNGLEQIDSLIRRTDDQWLDPLELREDSQLGVPGLVHAMRANGVIVANMPGGAWLESPAIQGFLPGLARYFQNSELLLPSVPSWWCGEAPAWAQASGRLENLVIKPTSPDRNGRTMATVMGSNLDEAEKRSWLSRISHRPSNYTLQELIPLSRVPIWTSNGLQERAMMLRLFAVTDGQGNYSVMPGGLTRIAGDNHGVVSMQQGGSSLDTWVRSSEPIDRSSNLRGKLQAKDLHALRRPVSSRAAEHLFWLGRYTERTSFSLRLMMRAQALLNDEEFLDSSTLSFLHEMCSKQGLADEYDPTEPQTQDALEAALIERLWHKPDNTLEACPNGLTSQLNGLAYVGGQLRDRLSSGHWRLLNDSARIFQEPIAPALRKTIPTHLLEKLHLFLLAMHGEQSDHMTRDNGWRFLQLGRQLERLVSACECLLSMTAVPGRAGEQGLALGIALADSTITYRSRYQHRFEWLPTLDLLIFDEDAPYAVRRILYKIDIVIDRLPGDKTQIRNLFEKVYKRGVMPDCLSLEGLQPPFPASTSRMLRTWLQELLDVSASLSDLIGAQFFRLAELPDQVIQGR